MFRVPPLQNSYTGLLLNTGQVHDGLRPRASSEMSCSFLRAENHLAVISAILHHEPHLIEGFYDFESESLSSSSSVVWRYDLPLVSHDVLLAFSIAKSFLSEEGDVKIKPNAFILICQFIQALPIEQKKIPYLFTHCPVLKSLHNDERSRFEDEKRTIRDRFEREIKYARDTVSLNLIAYLCFYPLSQTMRTLRDSGIEKVNEVQCLVSTLWKFVKNTNQEMTDVEFAICQKLFDMRDLNDEEIQGTFQALKESLVDLQKIKSQPERRYFIPLEEELCKAMAVYADMMSQFSVGPLLLPRQNQLNNDSILSMSIDLPISSDQLDERLALQIADDERQIEIEREAQLQKDEEIAKALQKELDQEHVDPSHMNVLKPLLGFFKSLFHILQRPKEPEDLSILKTYNAQKREAFIRDILSEYRYSVHESEDDDIKLEKHMASLSQLKAYYAADAHVPEILGHFTKAQVLDIFRLSDLEIVPQDKVRKLFSEWNQEGEGLPVFLKTILHSIDGYETYENDEELTKVMEDLFNALSFVHIKGLPNLVELQDQKHSILYYLIRVAAIESIFE